jgi:uncharacterized protein
MSSTSTIRQPRAFHVMTKPIGPICNLDCKYCFYLEKENLYPDKSSWRMTPQVLESYIRQYIEQQDVPEISFAWQGGEPTLMGVDFFRRVVELQKAHCPPGKTITNALQTNGTLLNDEWCSFFRDNNFLIGLSIDGPAELHDHYRVDKKGDPTFDRVCHGMELLKEHQVEFNNLVVVNRVNQKHPLEIYNFLKEHGSGFMQFIPLVERAGGGGPLDFAEPPVLKRHEGGLSLPVVGTSGPGAGVGTSPVTEFSVEPEAYGDFLIRIFDEWVRKDVGKVFVQIFDVQLGIWMGLPSSLCVFADTCGSAMAMEHNGDLYSCDHYVYPQYKLGNILDQRMDEMRASALQTQFGLDKRDTLPKYCRECDVRFACNGECPKHRFLTTPDGEPGLNYLCAGYKKFFRHIGPHMRTMANLLRTGKPADQIMSMLDDRRRATGDRRPQPAVAHSPSHSVTPSSSPPARNKPCPCGSGRKYRKCCGATADATG